MNMGVVLITDADPRWGREYETVAARVQTVLGATLTRVDHIGSTSVPGLDAKDILDVQATVSEDALLDTAFGELTRRGLAGVFAALRPPGAGHARRRRAVGEAAYQRTGR
jgi:GrpB-like predicted nucleotidyltransferase (UPF0157 family)